MNFTVERNPAVLWRRALTGVLLLVEGDEEMTKLSSPGDVVWQLIDETRDVEEVVEDLEIIYETGDIDTIRQDVHELLDSLAAADIVRLSGK